MSAKCSEHPQHIPTPRKNAAVDNAALYITRKQAAQLCGSTTQFIDKLLNYEKITRYRIGFGKRKQVRIRRSELLSYIERGS